MARPSDIIVVGAGIVGCAVAYELARRGASVEIVDERPVGMGATQASAGVLALHRGARGQPAARSHRAQPRPVRQVHGARVGGERRRRAVPPDRHARHRDHRRRDAPCTRATADVLSQRGRARGVLLDGATARAEEPLLGDGVVGGLFIDAHGFVSASELTRALAAAAAVTARSSSSRAACGASRGATAT